MDFAPLVPSHRPAIEGYGGGGFRINGQRFEGSLLVTADAVFPWAVERVEAVTLDSLAALWSLEPPFEILLLGCGSAMAFIEPALREAVRAQGPVIEPMDSGAACRTFNVLMGEERRVAAALIAIP